MATPPKRDVLNSNMQEFFKSNHGKLVRILLPVTFFIIFMFFGVFFHPKGFFSERTDIYSSDQEVLTLILSKKYI